MECGACQTKFEADEVVISRNISHNGAPVESECCPACGEIVLLEEQDNQNGGKTMNKCDKCGTIKSVNPRSGKLRCNSCANREIIASIPVAKEVSKFSWRGFKLNF